MKKLLIFVAAFTIMLMPFTTNMNQVSASQLQNTENIEILKEKLEEEGTTVNFEVDKTIKKQINKSVSSIEKQNKAELAELNKKGYKNEASTNSYVEFKDLVDLDTTYSHVGAFTSFMVKNQNELVQKIVWVNLETQDVIRYELNEITIENQDEKNTEEIFAYDVKEATSPSTGDFQTMGFTFNGVSFACSMSGLLLCGVSFGGLAIAHPLAAGVAMGICGTAFAAGCSVS